MTTPPAGSGDTSLNSIGDSVRQARRCLHFPAPPNPGIPPLFREGRSLQATIAGIFSASESRPDSL
jgi:hypothetical protein